MVGNNVRKNTSTLTCFRNILIFFFIYKKKATKTHGTKKREVIRGCTRKYCACVYLSKHRQKGVDHYVISNQTMPFPVGNVFKYALLFMLASQSGMFNFTRHN